MRLNSQTYEVIICDCLDGDIALKDLAAMPLMKVKTHFAEKVAPLIQKDRIEYLLCRFCGLICDDETIPDKQKDALLMLAEAENLAAFLAEMFIYAAVYGDKKEAASKSAPALRVLPASPPASKPRAGVPASRQTEPAENSDSIAGILTGFIAEHIKLFSGVALTFLLAGAAVMWAGVHIQKFIVLKMGCILGSVGFLFLIVTQLPHKKWFVAVNVLALVLGVGLYVLGKREKTDWLLLTGGAMAAMVGVLPLLALVFLDWEKFGDRIGYRAQAVIEGALRVLPWVFGIGTAGAFAGLLIFAYVTIKNFPTPQVAYTENRRVTALMDFKVEHEGFDAAVDAMNRYDYEEAARHFLNAKEALSHKSQDDPDIARLNVCLGVVYMELGCLEEGYDLLNSARVAFTKQKNEAQRLLIVRGLIMVYDIRTGTSERILREAKQILTEFDEIEDKTIDEQVDAEIARITVAGMAAHAFADIGDYASAQYCQEIAMKDINWLDWPLQLSLYINYGAILMFQEKYDEALAAFRTGVRIVEKSEIPDNNDVASLYFNMAQAYCGKKEYPKAQEYAQRSATILENLLGKDHAALISAYSACIKIYSDTEDYAEAVQYAEKAERISQLSWNDIHIDSAALYNQIGLTYKGMGDFPNAIAYMNRSIDILKSLLLLETKDGAQAYDNLAGVYMKMGDSDTAYEIYLKSLEINARIYDFDEQQQEEAKLIIADWIDEHSDNDSPPQ